MSKIALKSADSGTATFTIEAPATNENRTLVLPDFDGGITTSDFFTVTVNGSNANSDWTQASNNEPWIATLTVNGILETDRPIVDIDLSNVAFGSIGDVQNGWRDVYRVEASDDDEMKLYALTEPEVSFDLLIKVVR